MLIFWKTTTSHTWLSAQILVYQLNHLSKTHASRISFLLIHLELGAHTHTLTHSVAPYPPNPRWNWAPYLLHCPLNDAVPHWDKNASQDGYQRPKHSSGYQPTPSVTAAHGGVLFPPYDRLSAWQLVLLLSLCLWCGFVCAVYMCVCVPAEAAVAQEGCTIRRNWQSSRGQIKVQTPLADTQGPLMN